MASPRALAVLCAADLLVMLDGMVVTVALPAIEEDVARPAVTSSGSSPRTRCRSAPYCS